MGGVQEGPFAAFVRSFPAAVRRELEDRVSGPAEREASLARTERRARELQELHAKLVVDEPAEGWLVLSAWMLAFVETMTPFVGRTEAERAAERLVVEPFRAGIGDFLRVRFGIGLENAHEAYDRFVPGARERASATFGASFRYEAEPDGSGSFQVRRCLFHDFFRANGEEELTKVFCAFDNLWAEYLSDPVYGIECTRPTLLAAGDDACRFRFSKR